ncbi:MAG: hypothetical protein ACN6OB_06695 [Chryseobacterium jejuense]|uniref:hypothetical protein n=1 Tax=Chryseobacterium jejuense TaxID=445960 RepID=UPI003D09E7C4
MKTLIKKSAKTFKLADEGTDYVLVINISTVAQINTNVRYMATSNNLYDGSESEIHVNVIKGKKLRIRHIFDFSGINEALLDNAMKQVVIRYTLDGNENTVFPFENNTKDDLTPMKRIISVKVIAIK